MVSALVADVTTVALSKVTDRVTLWEEDPDSFDDFAAPCRWYRDGLKKAEMTNYFGAKVLRVVALERTTCVTSTKKPMSVAGLVFGDEMVTESGVRGGRAAA